MASPRPHLGERLEGLLVKGERIALNVGALLLGFILAAVLLDVAVRNLLGLAIRGVSELLTQILYLLVFLGVSTALQQGAFVYSDALFRFPFMERLRRFFRFANVLIQFTVFAALSVIAFSGLAESLVQQRKVGLPGYFMFAEWPIRLITFLGVFLALMRSTFSVCSTIAFSRKSC